MNSFLEVMTEPPDGLADLRIVAKDAPMSKQDRDTLMRCADEWEGHQKDLVMAYAKLIETNQICKAQSDMLREIKRTFPSIEGTITAQWR